MKRTTILTDLRGWGAALGCLLMIALAAAHPVASLAQGDVTSATGCVDGNDGSISSCESPGAVSVGTYNAENHAVAPEPDTAADEGLSGGVIAAIAVGGLGLVLGGLWVARRRSKRPGEVVTESNHPARRLAPTSQASTKPMTPKPVTAAVPVDPPVTEPRAPVSVTPPPPSTPAGWYPDPTQVQTQRFWDGSAWTEQRAPLSEVTTGSTAEALIPLAMALLGALISVVAVFLPRFESDTFQSIDQNSLIQNGDGILFLVFAGGAAIAAFRNRAKSGRSWGIVIDGLVMVAFAVYYGTGERLDLQAVGPLAQYAQDSVARGSPGIGIWAAGIGGALIALAGLQDKQGASP